MFQAYQEAFEIQHKILSEIVFEGLIWSNPWNIAAQELLKICPDLDMDKLHKDKNKIFKQLDLSPYVNFALALFLAELQKQGNIIILCTGASKEATIYKLKYITESLMPDGLMTSIDKKDICRLNKIKNDLGDNIWLIDDDKENIRIANKVGINALYINF